eukprot:jgi/Botrbrau1/7186/Bobra.0300s0016.1
MSGRSSRDATGPERKLQSAAIAKLAELRQARLQKTAPQPLADATDLHGLRRNGSSSDSWEWVSDALAPSCSSEAHDEVLVGTQPKRPALKDSFPTSESSHLKRLQKGKKTYLESSSECSRSSCSRTSMPQAYPSYSQEREGDKNHGIKPEEEHTSLDRVMNQIGSMSLVAEDHKENDRGNRPAREKGFLRQNNLPLSSNRTSEAGPSESTLADNFRSREEPAYFTSTDTTFGDKAEVCKSQADLVTEGTEKAFCLPGHVADSLYDHQVVGVKWLWGLFDKSYGGILADDMGLGKTMQCAAFLAGGFKTGALRAALIVAPKTLLAHWVKELAACGLGYATREYYGSSSHDRDMALRYIHQRGGVLLTTYGMVLHNIEQLMHLKGSDRRWDVLILDEGHKIKNTATQLAQKLRQVAVRTRLIISGTPVQNNLGEMHSLFDFVQPGLLGESRWFKMHYANVITEGSDKHASSYARDLSISRAAELRSRIQPFFLRREKSMLGAGNSAPEQGRSQKVEPPSMGCKNDLVVWLRLQPMQRKVYQDFLESDAVRAVFNQTGSALAALTVLKKICDHPALLTERATRLAAHGAYRADKAKGKKPSRQTSLDDFIVNSSDEEAFQSDDESDPDVDCLRDSSDSDSTPAAQAACFFEKQLIDELRKRGASASCKTVFVMALLRELVQQGHRALVFSQSRVMLNIIEAGLRDLELAFLRIDGTINSAAERQARVAKFQSRTDIPVFLLTSQVGGLGLTLTAADRVIIVDPAWNPSVDAQSVDRAYRIGQKKDVVVYRLITCGTVEEKIYRKQVFKGGLSRSSTKEGSQFRYFSQQDLRNLFRIEPGELDWSTTQKQLHDLHARHRVESDKLKQHLSWLAALEGFAGISDHDLLFSVNEEGSTVDTRKAEGNGTWFDKWKSESTKHDRVVHGGTKLTAGARRTVLTSSGWTGVSDIADLMQRTLRIGPSAAQAARPQDVQHRERPAESSDTTLKVTCEEIEVQIRKQEALLCNPLVKLPDGGANVKRRIQQLKDQLEALRGPLRPTPCSVESKSNESPIPAADSKSGGGEAKPATSVASTSEYCSNQGSGDTSATLASQPDTLPGRAHNPLAQVTPMADNARPEVKKPSQESSDRPSVIPSSNNLPPFECRPAPSEHSVEMGPTGGSTRQAAANMGGTTLAHAPAMQPAEDSRHVKASELGTKPSAPDPPVSRRPTGALPVQKTTACEGHVSGDAALKRPSLTLPELGLLSPRLAAAVATALPLPEGEAVDMSSEPKSKDVPAASKGPIIPTVAPTSSAMGPSAKETKPGSNGQPDTTLMAKLDHRIRALKAALEQDAALLRDPIKRQALPDGGMQVKARFKSHTEERETLKAQLSEMLRSHQK